MSQRVLHVPLFVQWTSLVLLGDELQYIVVPQRRSVTLPRIVDHLLRASHLLVLPPERGPQRVDLPYDGLPVRDRVHLPQFLHKGVVGAIPQQPVLVALVPHLPQAREAAVQVNEFGEEVVRVSDQVRRRHVARRSIDEEREIAIVAGFSIAVHALGKLRALAHERATLAVRVSGHAGEATPATCDDRTTNTGRSM